MEIKRNDVVMLVLLLTIFLCTVLFISGCTTHTIQDVKNADYVGKKVTVSGTVQNTIKIGTLSGYTLKDETDTIGVSSETLPQEGSNIRVTGILIKDTLLGYYIKID